jgi:hypothetical protein
MFYQTKQNKQTPWPQSASELYRSRDRRLTTKLVPTYADRGCRVVRATDPYGRNLGFIDRSSYFLFQVASHLYSRVWVDPVPDPLLRKSGSAGNQIRTSGSVARNSDHYTIEAVPDVLPLIQKLLCPLPGASASASDWSRSQLSSFRQDTIIISATANSVEPWPSFQFLNAIQHRSVVVEALF